MDLKKIQNGVINNIYHFYDKFVQEDDPDKEGFRKDLRDLHFIISMAIRDIGELKE